MRDGALKYTLIGHEDAVRAVRFDPAGRQVASGSADRTVRIWDVATGRPIHTLRGHDDAVYAIAYAGEGRLISGGWDQRLILWDTNSGEALQTWFAGSDQWVAALAASPARPLLASAGHGGGVKLWELG